MKQAWDSLSTATNCVIFFLCRPLLLSLFCCEQTEIFSPQLFCLSLKRLPPGALHTSWQGKHRAVLADGFIKIFCSRPASVETKVLSIHQISWSGHLVWRIELLGPPSLQGTPAVCKFISLAHQLPAHKDIFIFIFSHAAVVLKLLLFCDVHPLACLHYSSFPFDFNIIHSG